MKRLLFAIFGGNPDANGESLFDWNSFAVRLVLQGLNLGSFTGPEKIYEASVGYFKRIDVELAGIHLKGLD